jgi:hypothetical protein
VDMLIERVAGLQVGHASAATSQLALTSQLRYTLVQVVKCVLSILLRKGHLRWTMRRRASGV